jgi:hypothetical protein
MTRDVTAYTASRAPAAASALRSFLLIDADDDLSFFASPVFSSPALVRLMLDLSQNSRVAQAGSLHNTSGGPRSGRRFQAEPSSWMHAPRPRKTNPLSFLGCRR